MRAQACRRPGVYSRRSVGTGLESAQGGRIRRLAAVVALSLLGHAALFGAPSAPALIARILRTPAKAGPARAGLGEQALRVSRKAAIASERAALIERARHDRARGRLALGELLLEANALDAREDGRAFDHERARALYAKRLEALRERLREDDLRRAVPAVFGDLHYYGRPGGRMGDALLEGGGACEPVSQLLAASLHDLGLGARSGLRFYGGTSDGVTHLAPMLLDEDREFDLLTGGPALAGGIAFPAADLVEVYARAHGLAPPLLEAAGGAKGGSEAAAGAPAPLPEASSLRAGYPPNGDAFPGSIPLYQSQAVHEPDDDGGRPAGMPEPRDQALECAFFVRMAVLDPPRLGLGEWLAAPRREAPAIELYRVPTQPQLDRTLSLIRAVEQTIGGLSPEPSPADRADRLMGLACLSALYDRASVDFSLARERELAEVAASKKAEIDTQGAALLGRIDWGAPDGAALLARLAERYSGRNWLLLVLRGGEAPVLRLVEGAGKQDWGRINALAALVVSPSTRPRAIELLDRRPRAEQVEVMHEVFHAHDHLRPWASNYALEDEPGAPRSRREFVRAYRVFRGLAWGLWEGSRPAEALLSQTVDEARRAGLGRAWEESFLEYYGRNALNIHATRPDAPAIARELARWMEVHGYTDLEVYQTRLAGAGG